ncbi:ATP-binding protein [Vibrio sp. SCSIO 43136]|uniref:sensor histidine kinase n=1 Tax=Vibrio sp. SCSIO 43136 TaxID=2819101 RepID=UPI0020758408|nr:ATP-binding protein [Vibrio sp. SCSIO 43136]USD66949.1 PAS domain S-box protein [Vibrio sp. SCSIO 43136]
MDTHKTESQFNAREEQGMEVERKRSIAVRLFFYTLVCGFLMALGIASIQLVWELKAEKEELKHSIERIDTTVTSSIANSLWNLDEEQMSIQVNGIKNLPSVEYVAVYSYHNGDLSLSVDTGASAETNELKKSVDLTHSNEKIGVLVIEASYTSLYDKLVKKAWVILQTQLLINLVVTFCVLFIVYQVMTRHINRISHFFQINSDSSEEELTKKLKLHRKTQHDEIDILVESINKLHENVSTQLEKRRKMNGQLAYERDFTKVIIQSSPSLICSLTEDFIIQLANREVEDLLGVPEAELLDKNWFDYFVDEDIDRQSRFELLENIPEFELVLNMTDCRGEERYVQWRLIRNRELSRVICFGVDVTELTNTENALITLNQQLEQKVTDRTLSLEQANLELSTTLSELENTQASLIEAEKMASLGGLVGGVAHEINTPLGISVTATSFIEEKLRVLQEGFDSGKLSKTQFSAALGSLKESTDILTSNLSRAEQLVSSFKQVAVDQTSQEIYSFNVRDNLDKVLLSLSHELKVAQVKYEIECPDDIVIDSYPSGYIQVYTNLITNSIKHGFEDWDGDRIVSFKISNDDTHLHIEYRDSGKGIDQKLVNKIFEPFITTKRGKGGSGLGANIIYNLVTQLLQGKIECHSELGQGAVFNISVPLVLATDKEMANI